MNYVSNFHLLILPTLQWHLICDKNRLATKLPTVRFLLYVLVLLYVLFWFLVDRTVHFHYCITLPIIRTVLKKMWILLLVFITVLLFLLYVLFSKTRPVTFISTVFNRNLRVLTYLQAKSLASGSKDISCEPLSTTLSELDVVLE